MKTHIVDFNCSNNSHFLHSLSSARSQDLLEAVRLSGGLHSTQSALSSYDYQGDCERIVGGAAIRGSTLGARGDVLAARLWNFVSTGAFP